MFTRSRATISRWRQRDDPTDLRSRRPLSRRPRRTRKWQWTAGQEQAVLALRNAHPRSGQAKLVHLLRAQGLQLSVLTVGRILTSLKACNLLIAPPAVQVRRRLVRPDATRTPRTGEMIQLDTMHLRCAVLGVRSQATAGTATAFLDELIERMPMLIQAIQVDGGSEFSASFEPACEQRGIACSDRPPRNPKLNERIERRNGTIRRALLECSGGDLDLPSRGEVLRAFETASNTQRPHQALGSQTPTASVTAFCVSHVSN